MRHVALWAVLAGCAAQAADNETVIGEEGGPRLVQTFAEYDCEEPAEGGVIQAEIPVASTVMVTVEVCGTIEATEEVACYHANTTGRFDDFLRVMCDDSATATGPDRFVRVWTITEEAAE
jgi:hypothetical protein